MIDQSSRVHGEYYSKTGSLLFAFLMFSNCGNLIAQEGGVDDIRDIIISKPPASMVPVVFSIIVLVAALVGGAFAIKKFLSRSPVKSGPSPEQVARERLHGIHNQFEDWQPNKASLETSETVKDFLTAQYNDPIRFETAEEYLTRITHASNEGGRKLSAALTEEVRSFMSISQELKFAQLKEARGRIPALIKQAETIIGMAVREARPSKK